MCVSGSALVLQLLSLSRSEWAQQLSVCARCQLGKPLRLGSAAQRPLRRAMEEDTVLFGIEVAHGPAAS
eukprot:11465690-Prorocentrum_lima.AAC.1